VTNLTIEQARVPSFLHTGDLKLVYRFSDSMNRTYIEVTILAEVKTRSLTWPEKWNWIFSVFGKNIFCWIKFQKFDWELIFFCRVVLTLCGRAFLKKFQNGGTIQYGGFLTFSFWKFAKNQWMKIFAWRSVLATKWNRLGNKHSVDFVTCWYRRKWTNWPIG
jgi:hypothetical protein